MGWQSGAFKGGDGGGTGMFSMRMMMLALAALALTVPAAAQVGGFDGENFLKAVREVDGNKAMELLNKNSSTVLNYRGQGSGETALTIAARRRDSTWLGFLLGKGADPNAGDNRGETPLLIAARLGWVDGAETLLARSARVDGANRLGETPLIVAVQARQPQLVKLLLEKGADPDKRDHAAGFSARDYAKRDSRSAEMTRLIETTRPALKIKAGPIL